MNSSCPIGAFGYGPNHIPWTIRKSNLSFQTTVVQPHFLCNLKRRMSKTWFRPVFRPFLALKTWLGPVLVSGGPDTYIVIFSVKVFE